MDFTVGDSVVYPHHGAAEVKAVEQKTVNGKTVDILVLRIEHGDLIVRVPADNVDLVGVRSAVSDQDLDDVFAVLKKREFDEPENWSRRYKANQDKLASGDILRAAEVIRDLHRRDCNTGLSMGEKTMLNKARGILVSEIAVAQSVDETAASSLLDEILAA
jgi:CarD family transcriptional regulator